MTKTKRKKPLVSPVTVENVAMSFVLPYAIYMYLKAKRRVQLQADRIMTALEADQDLVDRLADAEFELSTDGFAVLSCIQILQDRSKISAQIDPIHVKRAIIQNIGELLEGSENLGNEVTFLTTSLSESVLEITLAPTWLSTFVKCKEDIKRTFQIYAVLVIAAILVYIQFI